MTTGVLTAPGQRERPFPEWIIGTAVRTLPPVALVLLAIVFVPIFAFEVTVGPRLLVKGVRVRERA